MSTAFCGFMLAVSVTFAVQASTFRSSHQVIVALVGNDVTMECSVNNLRQSELVIWQNGSIILSAGRKVFQPPESNKVFIEGDSDDTFSLRIRSVTVYDAGNYSCQVTGRGTQYSQLIVNVPASIDFFPEGKIVTVVEESEFSLTCKGYGSPKPLIQWIFRGGEGSREMFEQEGEENVMFSEIRRLDSGEYECRATNGAGLPASHKIQVEVEYAPSLADQGPVIYVAPGQDATIECFFSAHPDIDPIVWGHNNTQFHPESRTNVKENRRKTDIYDVWALHIRELQPDQLGTYSCLGENKIGTVYDTVILSPFPYDLKINSVHKGRYSNQYTLHWAVSSPMKLVNYTIAIKQLNDSFITDWRNFSIPISVPYRTPKHSLEYTFQQLAANTSYTVLIKARNLYGSSDWSESLTFNTSESRGAFAESKTSLLLMLLVFSLLKNWDCIC